MRKILIAFLGNANYQQTSYRIEDKLYENRLAFMPIFSHFSPIDHVYIIGTKESRWEMLNGFPHTPVFIPYCRREEDFWKMFDILATEIDFKESEVIFDITHCFRTIPVFTAIYIRFIRCVEPTARFSHFLYGSYEPGSQETPIIDLAPALELLDWVDATTSFTRYGELEGLVGLIKDKTDHICRTNTCRPTKLKMLAAKLEKLSNLSGLTYVPLLPAIGREISEGLDDQQFRDEIVRHVKPLNLLIDKLRSHARRFSKETHWASHLEAASWYLENNRPSQSLIVLREVIVTYLCEKDDCNVYDIQERGRREEDLNTEAMSQQSKEPLVRLWQKIRDARNRVGHALMKRVDKDLSPKRALGEVEKLIKETKQVLEGGRQID
jgi:hypothetical protein